MKDAKDLIPWKVTDISIRPYDAMWSMNPSIHFDGSTWRCVLRCTDYAMPNGKTIRSPKARPAGNQTKNAMVIFDPQTWKPISVHKMHEHDKHPRVPCANVGYEDMRIFKTDRGGLQGIAASLHLDRGGRSGDGGPQNQPPEQVLLSFDGEYNIVAARPIRGDWWSGTPQKNWVPFDHCEEPRFLYSIDRGTMFDDRGAINGDAASARPSPSRSTPARPVVIHEASSLEQDRERAEREQRDREEREREREQQERERRDREERDRDRRSRPQPQSRLPIVRGTDVQMVRGSKMVSTTAPRSSTRGVARRSGDHSRQTVSSGRALPVKYGGLRGGSQLVHIGDGKWLGIGHEMNFLKGLKHYWHNFYLVDSRGRMMAVSPSMKLASNGIEFAAGMAIDGDRVVISFGVDDMESKLGETSLSAVLRILRPVEH